MSGFLQTRWNGEAPMETVFLRDMLLVGTTVNIACAVAAWTMRSADMHVLFPLLARMLPVPWTLFLFVAVWRSAERDGGSACLSVKVIAVMWLITMFVILSHAG